MASHNRVTSGSMSQDQQLVLHASASSSRIPTSSSVGSQLVLRNPSNTELPSGERIVSNTSVQELIHQFEHWSSPHSSPQQDTTFNDAEADDPADDSAFARTPPQLPSGFASQPSQPGSQFVSPYGSQFASGLATPNFDNDHCLLSPQEIADIMSSPIGDLLDRYPRIGMTPSMLYAHAHLRGNGDLKTDPVHQALYLGADRDFFRERVRLPQLDKTKDMEAFHKGAKLFYDPVDDVKSARGSGLIEHREKTGETYDEFMATFKPTIGKQYTRGDNVYNEFGYLLRHGNWVDPDSIGSMNDSILRSENQEHSHQFSNDLPVLPTTHKGPKIMTEEELDDFYDDYNSYVSDGEGDPRNNRITPADFAKLAQGAVIGRTAFDESIFEPSFFDTVSPPSPPNIPNSHDSHTRERSYDIQDGSRMSDVRTESSNPSMQSSPRGVNIYSMGKGHAWLNPITAHNMELENYGAQTGNPVNLLRSPSSSSASDNFNMTEDLAIAALGSVDAFDSAVEEVESQRREFEKLRFERENALLQKEGGMAKKEELMRDVWFLERELQEKKEKMDSRKKKRDEKRKERVKRYLSEQEQELTEGIWREKSEGERVKGENEVLDEEVKKLKAEKKKIVEELDADESESDTDGGVSCDITRK